MPTDLLQSLRRVKFFDKGDPVDIELLETLESTAATVTRFKVFKQGQVFNLIHKKFRADWIGGGGAELAWYKNLASLINPGISPTFYGGEINRQTPYCYLFLEDVSETHEKVPETGPFTAVNWGSLEQIVDLLLSLHIHWWNHPRLKDDYFMQPQGGPLRLAHAAAPETINKYVQSLQYSFAGLVENMGAAFLPDWIPIYERAIQAWPRLLTQRVNGRNNLTLLHGDFHIWNLYFPRHPQQSGLLVVDWETYKRGTGVYDLAYLLITGLNESVRREQEASLLRQYHNGLQAAGIENYTWQDCVQDYRLSIVANLFPPLMWKSAPRVRRAMAAFADWQCRDLLS